MESSSLLPVRCACGGCSTWTLIELQGELERSDGAPLDNLDVGVFCSSAPVRSRQTPAALLMRTQETLQLTVGYHRLEGKLVPLRTPLAILSRHEDEPGAPASAFVVVGIVRSKYLFKNRPLALISAPEAGKRAKTADASASSALFSLRKTLGGK